MTDGTQSVVLAPTAPVFPAAARMPVVGLGTWTQKKPGDVRDAVELAIRHVLGYRHIDCAAEYGNEEEVGAGLAAVLQDGTVRREELWITTKLDNPDHAHTRVEAACRESLRRLSLSYLDLYLVHWPFNGRPQATLDPSLEETWGAMEGLVRKGLARAIGVSNTSAKKLERLLAKATIRPAVNQVEAHPYWRNQELIDWCKERGILVTAYSPLGSPHTHRYFKRGEDVPLLMQDETLKRVAEKHNKSPADILVSWAVQRGTACLPKSTKEEHLRSNLEAASWRLPEDDFAALSAFSKQYRMLDGAWCISPEGPYRSLEELWDTEHERGTSNVKGKERGS
ncbi:hypothetical protein ABPG77_008297 [Micractinium sp. CCAP 211/92]